MKIEFNLPSDKIHDTTKGYGYLVFPLFRCWIMIRDYEFTLTDKKYGFHNCRITGIK